MRISILVNKVKNIYIFEGVDAYIGNLRIQIILLWSHGNQSVKRTVDN